MPFRSGFSSGPSSYTKPQVPHGREMAKMFRRIRGLKDVRRCDLDAILEEDEIELATLEGGDPGCAALLIRFDSDKGGGIMLPPVTSLGRRRFSIAHELAHFHMPTHRKANLQGGCSEADLTARGTDSQTQEWEANDFAAEILMPFRLFSEDARKRDVSISTAEALADPAMYDVSLLAAARRIVDTTRQAAALVVSHAGRVSWVIRSMPFGGWITERGQRLLPDTLASAAFRGEGTTSHPRQVPAAAWFDDALSADGTLLESTYRIGQTDEVVSLLWRTESAHADDDFDEGP